jgi:hypothetical protein
MGKVSMKLYKIEPVEATKQGDAVRPGHLTRQQLKNYGFVENSIKG